MSSPDGGRIGLQETAYMLGVPLYINAVFTFESHYAYPGGNSSYIWVPAGVLLSLGLFLLVSGAMQRAKANTLGELYDKGLGKIGGRICMAELAALLLIAGLAAMLRFISMLYTYVFVRSVYSSISLWIMGAVCILAFWGMETIGRLSKLLGIILLVTMLVNLILPAESYELYRLYPLPGNQWEEIGAYSLRHIFTLLPVLLGGLSMAESLHGRACVKKAGCIGGIGAAVLAFLTQLCISLTYGYQDLSAIYFPLYRLDMDMLQEGYFFRLDKISLFLWLAAELVAAAYFLFAASRIAGQELGLKNSRPAVAAFSVLLSCALFYERSGGYWLVERVKSWLDLYGWLLLLPGLLAACIGALRHGSHKEKEREIYEKV